jgi:UDPglucose 6-dehydrogenase
MRIAVVGLGYVGLSNACLLAQHNDVVALDVSPARVAALEARRCPMEDPDIQAFLDAASHRLRATLDAPAAYRDAEYVLVATPTDYDPVTHKFDTRSVESVIREVRTLAPQALVIVKSTVPVASPTASGRRSAGTG